ncbi:TIR domain-containing protein [Aggregatilinea lenta]|uniref:TIR domain-containing protein n=1 Tax=Aggregatilinea lenta TaxID=913108 RepID=UPI000E5AC7F4|nr:TIR domain-containing protein [Aggregatilinea lenta]
MLDHVNEILDQPLAIIPLDGLSDDKDLTDLLVAKGYATVGDVYDLQAEGISLITNVEFDRADTLWKLVLNVVSNPTDSEPRTAEAPSTAADESIFQLPQNLRPTIEMFFSETSKSRIFTVLVRRFGLNGSKWYTLDEIGRFLDISRERIRQLQNDGIRMLRKAMLLEDVNQLNLEDSFTPFSNEFSSEAQFLKRQLEEENTVHTEERIFEDISQRYGMQLTTEHRKYCQLLFFVFGWERVENSLVAGFDIDPFWITKPGQFDIKELKAVTQKLVNYLMNECIKVSYFDLKISVNKRARHSDFMLRTAIKVCSDIELLDNDTFQIAFHRLRGSQDQAYRVLVEHGEPLSHHDIHREIARRLATMGENIPTRRTVSNAMAHDPRFIPIGKRAWALAEWDDVVQDTVINVMRDFFHRHNRPAREKEIFEYVQQKRPVKRSSITAYLCTEHFTRVDRGLYQPADWQVTSKIPVGSDTTVWTKERFAKLVVSAFEQCQVDQMPTAQLVTEISKNMDSPNSGRVYTMLHNCPAVKMSVISERPRRLEARLIRDYEFSPTQTKRDRLENTVREVLSHQPEQTMLLVELRNKVTKRGNIHPYTFYSYLSDMPDIQKNVVEGTRPVLVTLVNVESYPSSVPDAWDSQFTYDIAISYAGKERNFASDLAECLRGQKLRVFYDRNQLPDLIGRNLLDELMVIYRDKARLCVILASRAYNESTYAQHERQSAQDRDLMDKGYIFLARLDDVEQIKGFHRTVAYIDWNEYGLDGISKLAIEQLSKRP